MIHALTATFESASVAARETEHYLRVCAGDCVVVHCVDYRFPDDRRCILTVWWSVAPSPRHWKLPTLAVPPPVIL